MCATLAQQLTQACALLSCRPAMPYRVRRVVVYLFLSPSFHQAIFTLARAACTAPPTHTCMCPTPAAGFTPGAAALTALSSTFDLGTSSDWIYCAFRDQSVTPYRMSVYKLNVKDWGEVSQGARAWLLTRGQLAAAKWRLVLMRGQAAA